MDRKKVLPSIIPNIGFNLEAQEKFAKDHGITFVHYTAIPSPIGLKDRGDYRRPDSLDTFSSNGFIYEKVGEFTGTILGNSKSHGFDDSIFDSSTARLVLPKYYNDSKEEIKLLPGDRVYAKDLELSVPNYQRVDYVPGGLDSLQFPVKSVQTLIDSTGKKYKQGVDFKIQDGKIKWDKNNPGIDPDTGKGRVYSIRYNYVAFWYINRLINEIRITNNGTNKEPERMPYHAVIQREYVYHNKANSKQEAKKEERTQPSRQNEKPIEDTSSKKFEVKVNLRDFE